MLNCFAIPTADNAGGELSMVLNAEHWIHCPRPYDCRFLLVHGMTGSTASCHTRVAHLSMGLSHQPPAARRVPLDTPLQCKAKLVLETDNLRAISV